MRDTDPRPASYNPERVDEPGYSWPEGFKPLMMDDNAAHQIRLTYSSSVIGVSCTCKKVKHSNGTVSYPAVQVASFSDDPVAVYKKLDHAGAL